MKFNTYIYEAEDDLVNPTYHQMQEYKQQNGAEEKVLNSNA